MSSRSRCGAGSAPSGVEELDILLLPGDANHLARPAPEIRVAVAGHLGEHPLAAGREVQLDEVAEELDEDDLARRGVLGSRVAARADLDGCGPDRDERRLADGGRR